MEQDLVNNASFIYYVFGFLVCFFGVAALSESFLFTDESNIEDED